MAKGRSSRWVIIPSWLSWSWRSFLYSSSVYSCHFFLISSASVRSITIFVLYRAHLCMKCSLGISNFLEEISSLSHSVVFLYFFALIAEEVFLISSCYSLRNLYTGQEATVRIGHGTTDWFLIGKGVVKAVYSHPVYLTYMQSTSWKSWAGWSTSWNQDCREKYQ